MSKKLNLKGQTFGKLTAISDAIIIKEKTYFNFLCVCGKEKIILGTNVKVGHTTSCGCAQKEIVGELFSTHGKTKTKEYYSWVNMKTRCLNEKNINYKDYGARGITVCDRWLNSFENFLEDMGMRPQPNYSLERIDVNGNYEPNNCKWADVYEQANNKRDTKYFNCAGLRKTLQGWANYFGEHQANISVSIKAAGIKKTYAFYKKKYNGNFPDLKQKREFNKIGSEYNKSKKIRVVQEVSRYTVLYNSIRSAAKSTKVHHQIIRTCAKNSTPYKGLTFEFI